ncbi:biotin/lipoyl-binding protein [Hymenobacter rubripertinctus]|nr:biotin/lipoyl-binding protein [Hymenobacter rubripertinctus]
MKKLLGVTLVVFVAVSSAILPLWLTPTAVLADSDATLGSQLRPLIHAPNAAPAVGSPVFAGQAGRVHEVYVHEGQQVRQGQVLLKLLEKIPSVQQQQQRARLSRQQRAYAALLARQPAASAAALIAARQQLATTQAHLARLVPMLSFVFVTAPADGLVTRSTARPGDQLTPQTPVATLATGTPPDTTVLLPSVE